MTARRRPEQPAVSWGSADGGVRGSTSKASSTEAEAEILEARLADARRERAAEERVQQLRRELEEHYDPEAARRRRAIVDGYEAVLRDGKKGTVEDVADYLSMSESSLKRERAELHMAGWPPKLDPG